jgi:hypothetical protein
VFLKARVVIGPLLKQMAMRASHGERKESTASQSLLSHAVRQSDDGWVEITVVLDRALLNTGSAVSLLDFWITRCGDLTASVNRSTENSLFSKAAADRIATAFALLNLFKLQSSCPYDNCHSSRPLPLRPKVKGDASGIGCRSGERTPARCGRRNRLVAV